MLGRFAQLFDLDDQVVGAKEIGVPARRALIDAGRQVTQPRDLVRDFRSQQQTAGTGLGALADRDLDRISLAQVLDIDAIATG